uniref:RING-type domain-containing protein n=1 Tax=Brugia pahangi TaxID=6280 RepID=A0A0N4TG54_BRUPA
LQKVTDVLVYPTEDCSGKTSEVDESNLCDRICKKYVEEGKYITTSCCQAKICSACFETISGRKYSTGVEERCPSTECLRHADIARCQAEVKCKNLPISGFPSKDECEHAMCIQCLEKMIDNCESAGSLPRCPNESCNALYNVESVIAMRAMLPGKSAFFNKLSLDNNYYYLIKDEIVTVSNDTVLLSLNTR